MAEHSQLHEFRGGWPTLATATVGSAVGVTALLFYSMGSFTGALESEFGWSRAQISTAFLWTTVALTITAAPLGWLLDRLGPRRVALVAVPGLALSLVLLSRFDGGLVQFGLLFALAGLLGAGTTSIVYTKAVNTDFRAARGLALGISLAGLGIAALVLPPLVTATVQAAGWRSGYLVLAGLSLLVLPFVAVGLRDATSRSDTTGDATREIEGANRGEALRSRTFWLLLAGVLLVGFSVPAVIPHMIPMLTDAGLPPATAAGIAGLIGIGVIAGRVGIGFLLDRIPAPLVAAPMFLVAAGGCLLLAWGGTGPAPLAALMMGVCFGAEADLIAFLCGQHFGLRAYGFIYGIVYALFTVAVALGPIWVGALYDRNGSYEAALLSVAALLAVGAVVFLTLPWRPRYGVARAPGRLFADNAR